MERKKVIVIVLVAAMVMTVFAGMASANTVNAQDWSGWAYSKTFSVKENSGKTLTDYPVLVKLSGDNFPVEAKTDGSDIRFSFAGQELSYWIDEFDGMRKKAEVWVKVPFVPASEMIYLKMHYGNPIAVSESNGSAMFEFFDDFEQDAVGSDPSKWTVTEKHNTYVEIVNSPTYKGSRAVKLHTDGKPPKSGISHNLSACLTKGAWQLLQRFETTSESAYICLSDETTAGPVMIHYSGANGLGLYAWYSEKWHFISSATVGTWYRIEVIFDTYSDTYEVYVDGTPKASAVPFAAATGPISNVRLSQHYNVIQMNYIDLNIVRKNAPIEPTVSFEAEAEPRVSIATDKVEYGIDNKMKIIVSIANSTEDNSTFQWYWLVPQSRVCVPVLSIPVSADYCDSLDFGFSISSEWGSKPFGNVFYVQLFDACGEIFEADSLSWIYIPGGEAIPVAEVDIEEQINRTIEEMVQSFPN